MSSYLNFDLVIERRGEQYRASVIGSPAGEADASFPPPFAQSELEALAARLERSRGGMRRANSPQLALAKEMGARLHAAALSPAISALLARAVEEAEAQGAAGVRVRLHLDAVPELAVLPWELLFDADPRVGRFVALAERTPLVRYLHLPERVRPLQIAPPVEILVIVSSPADDRYAELDVEGEWRRLQEALGPQIAEGRISLTRLSRATLSALQDELSEHDYHVLHYIGHGRFDDEHQDGLLVFEGERGGGNEVSAERFGALLYNEPSLRLAVLNACEGGRASALDPYAGMAQTLVRMGVPAVVAMQFEISDRAAIVFARQFYRGIALGHPVDRAVTDARMAVFQQVSEVEWATPVLYMRAPDGRVFDIESSPSARDEPATAVAAMDPNHPPRAAAAASARRPPLSLIPAFARGRDLLRQAVVVVTALALVSGGALLVRPLLDNGAASPSAIASAGGLMQVAPGSGLAVRIVSSFPMSGTFGPEGEGMFQAITLAVEDGGSSTGVQIAYEPRDNASPKVPGGDPALEAANAQRAADQRDVVAYVGAQFGSNITSSALPILCAAGLGMISPTDTYPGFTKAGRGDIGEPDRFYPSCKRNYARVIPTNDVQGSVAAHWARNQLGAKRVYVLHDGTGYARPIVEAFRAEVIKVGLVEVGYALAGPNLASYRTIAGLVAEANPDLVYYAGTRDSAPMPLFRDLRATGRPMKIMTVEAVSALFLQGSDSAADGIYVTRIVVAPSGLGSKTAEWAARYQKRFGRAPGGFAHYAYEAAKVAIDAIRRAGARAGDRAAVRDEIMATRAFDGILGRTWSFSAEGDTTFSVMSGLVVGSGELKLVATPE